MKRLIIAALAVSALIVPQVAGAATLSQRVNKLEAEMNCLVRYGLSEWDGYLADDGGGGAVIVPAANLDLVFGDTSPPHVWVLATKNTSSCRARFSRGANPFDSFSARPMMAEHLNKLPH